MGRRTVADTWHLQQAWNALMLNGGPECLPPVVRTNHVLPLFEKPAWFRRKLNAGQVPGDQVVLGGVWFCARENFVCWLKGAEQPTIDICKTDPSIGEVAELLNITPQQVLSWIEIGALPVQDGTDQRIVPREALRELLYRQAGEPRRGDY